MSFAAIQFRRSTAAGRLNFASAGVNFARGQTLFRSRASRYLSFSPSKGHQGSQAPKGSVPRHPRHWKRAAIVVTTALGIGGYVVYNYDTAYLVASSAYRSAIVAKVTCQVAWDYYRNFPELPLENDPSISADERQRILGVRSSVHLRSAERLKRVLMVNGGIYIKLGQHLSAMQYILPMEWCTTMQSLQDQNTASSVEDVGHTIHIDTGKTIEELFSEFDEVPIGVASLAQVHRAVLRESGQEVAVKVQHPMVRTYSDIDIATTSVMLEFIHSIFPDFKFMWVGAELRESLPHELDFRNDKTNAEQVEWNFAAHADIPLVVPKMLQAAERVLIMEFIRGQRCDDLAFLRQHSISPSEVSREIGRAFAEMTFVHGYLHCDPHPGNLFVRPRDRKQTTHGYNFDLVLLDHGLYRQLSSRFRYEYSEMWRALMRGNKDQIIYWSHKLSGTDLYRLFSIILTGQNWETIESKSLTGSSTPLRLDIDTLREEQPDLLRQIAEILSSVPPVLRLVLKTNDLLRMIDKKLFADQPPAVQQHAQTRTWLRVSHYCLIAIRNARAADINHNDSRLGFIKTSSRLSRLLLNWIRFWVYDTTLSAYSVFLTIEDVFIRWRAMLTHLVTHA
ncbi:ABC1 family-domain-containing protein [Kickxella alabastrina]|uniref:ABC1 family-domain-containing protein n=1 Tax=Kickxella alabastrina TaxID=61397 RepID=UPI002220FDE5|nr:ABC1 family-domain-containing protein [Kickxella alabastrina]KAI7823910.1 ABC1 family-domain-containing protein [Kickxella alabastrina]